MTIEVLADCPCGAEILGNPNLVRDRRKKFCSRVCAGTYGGGRVAKGVRVSPYVEKATHCPRCGLAKDADNTLADGACRNCRRAWERAWYAARSRTKRAQTKEPKPEKPTPVPPVTPPWRPVGFTAEVPVRRTR